MILLLETDVIPALALDVEGSITGLELAGVLEGAVDVVLEAMSELATLLDLEEGVDDNALDSVEEVGLEEGAAEGFSELTAVLV